MQRILTLETNKYAIKLDNFEGPLDLLCTLIEKNKMNIYDINLNEITDQYIDYINQMEELNLEVTSEFLIMASTLLYLKSKNLLPNKEESTEEITEDELIRRIVEYKKYKDITTSLRNNFNVFSNRMYKLPENIELPKQNLDTQYDNQTIPTVYSALINRNKEKINQNAKNIEKIAIIENYTVASKLKDMFRELIRNKRFVFNKLFSIKQHNKTEVVTAFSGLLELSKRSKVMTTQEELFGDINVEKARNQNKRIG
jgi:segregation and condensation protein A